jgi:hypothetical protein
VDQFWGGRSSPFWILHFSCTLAQGRIVLKGEFNLSWALSRQARMENGQGKFPGALAAIETFLGELSGVHIGVHNPNN